MSDRNLFIRQIDEQLAEIKAKKDVYSLPKGGWIKTIRHALGMTGQQLATRLGVHRTRVVRIELDEIQQNVTLKTLTHVAHALECDLYYVIVPKTSIAETIKERAQATAKIILNKVNYTMNIEGQGISNRRLNEQYEELVEKLLKGNPKYLWLRGEKNDEVKARKKE